MIRETKHQAMNGLLALVVLPAAIAVGLYVIGRNAAQDLPLNPIPGFVLVTVALVCLGGLFVVNPNEGRVLTLFGKYVGTVKVPGLWPGSWVGGNAHIDTTTANIERGTLFPCLRAVQIYRCPTDQSRVDNQPQPLARAVTRSVAL